jgi:hypothetical protein
VDLIQFKGIQLNAQKFGEGGGLSIQYLLFVYYKVIGSTSHLPVPKNSLSLAHLISSMPRTLGKAQNTTEAPKLQHQNLHQLKAKFRALLEFMKEHIVKLY